MSEEPEWGIRYTDQGTQAIGRLEDGKRVGVAVSERYAGQSGDGFHPAARGPPGPAQPRAAQ